MHEKEMIERLIDGYKVSISCAKEMHGLQPKAGWDALGKQLDEMLYLVRKLLNAKGQSRQRLLAGVQQVEDSIGRAVSKG
jgi:hypothetical protein